MVSGLNNFLVYDLQFSIMQTLGLYHQILDTMGIRIEEVEDEALFNIIWEGQEIYISNLEDCSYNFDRCFGKHPEFDNIFVVGNYMDYIQFGIQMDRRVKK